ncbi:protein trunk [Culicoides brevitarsis]|uniref:protein trunk n=1 Tax=Culicoides brevitarsis TaxID=469753 RepID=UPI00307CB391
MSAYLILIIYGFLIAVTDSRNIDTIECESLPENVLVKILGSAYNPRYMSVDAPSTTTTDPQVLGKSGKRGASDSDPDFYVDDEFQMDLSNQPAWQVDFITKTGGTRNKRALRSSNNDAQLQREKPWFCDSKIRWQDLGPDYYPRWIRTIECVKHDCWYGKATCKPKSFTVKILKRQRGKCTTAEGLAALGLIDNQKPAPNAQLEVWTWEERAVNFCCDCVLARKSFY